MNNLLLILAMVLLGNGNISLFDNKNKSNKPKEESVKVEIIEPSTKSNQGKRSSPKVRKIKKIKKKTKSKEGTREGKMDPIKSILNFDIMDVNKGINLMDLSEEDLDRGMEIIVRTKKYMNKEERSLLIKLESVLDLVKGIKKLNDINTLSEEDDSEFFRSMDEEDKKNMMIKEILEVFPENKKQSFEKALEMKKMIDLFAELFLPDGEEGGGFSLSSLADINNLGSINNLKLLGSLLRNLDGEEEKESEYVEIEEDDEEENTIDDYDEYLEVNKAITNNKKYSKSKSKRNRNKRKKQL